MKFDKFDKILLTHDDVKTILAWDTENHKRFNSVDFPLEQGVLLITGYWDVLQRDSTTATYFNITEEAIHFKLIEWDTQTELFSCDVDEQYYKTQKLSNYKIGVKGVTEQQAHEDFKRQLFLLMATFQYITNNERVIKETKVTKSITKKAKKKSSNNRNRVVKISTVQYTLDFSEPNNNPRQYERHADSWRVRGHWRHYKSGKSVWIQPHVKGYGEAEPKTYKV